MNDDGVQIKLDGDRDIVAAFRDLRDFLPRSALRSAVRQGAQLMAQFIALVAPKLTGRLARNIAVRTRRVGTQVSGRVVINTQGGADDPENAFYWRFLEEGFHDRAGGFHQFPFIAGVFDSKNREAAQKVIDACEQSIKRAENKARRVGAL